MLRGPRRGKSRLAPASRARANGRSARAQRRRAIAALRDNAQCARALSGPVGGEGDFDRRRGNGYFADWHRVVKRMHRGDIIGTHAGRYLSLANGDALLYLAVSGFLMFFVGTRPRSGR